MNKPSVLFFLFSVLMMNLFLKGELYSQSSQGINSSVKRYDFTLRMRDRVLIDCTKFIPEEQKPPKGWPVFMFCHGFSESKETEVPDAMGQAQFGYYTFVYSMRGQGNSGGLSNLISTVEMNDLLEIVDYIKQDPEVDSSRFIIFGASQGGIIPFMSACNGAKVSTVMSDLSSPEFASSWIENGSIKVTFLFSVNYDSSLVRYTDDVKNLRRWALSKENDKWDSLAYFLPRERDFLDKVSLCKVPVLITNAWQDRFFNAAGMIKATKLLTVPFMAYYGAVDGHGADTSCKENKFLSDYDNYWENYWLGNMPHVISESVKYHYASSRFPIINNQWTFSHYTTENWPPANLVPLRLYFHPGGKLLDIPDTNSDDTVGFWNDLLDTSFTMLQAINTSFKGEFFNKRFRKNTVVFESAPLVYDYQLVGVPKIKLFYSSTADVCQYNVQIWEVKPGSEARFVTRINYTDRNYKPGVIKEQTIEGPAYSHLFQQGDKIRIVFTNLDSQPADSFLTTNPYVLPVLKKAYNSIFIGKTYPSFIEFPVVVSSSGIAVEHKAIKEFRLYQNFPNPFNNSTDIRITLDKQAHVTLKIFNNRGGKIATILNRKVSSGTHTVSFDISHRNLPGGKYYYEMKIGDTVKRMNMDLIK
jgi:predicted acyl esterase